MDQEESKAVCAGGKRGRKEVGGHGSRKDRGRGEAKIKVDEVLREMEEGGEERKERMKGRRREISPDTAWRIEVKTA